METRVRVFLDFLEPRKVKEGEAFTHTSKANQYAFWYPGRYYIGVDDREEFEELYQKLVQDGIHITLTERPEKYGPLRVDADFKASLDCGVERQYSDSTLQGLIRVYQEEITKIIDPEVFEQKMLWCMVLEKECPRIENGIIKDGFHLHFPHFICDAWTQDVYLRNQVTKRMTNEGVWKGCNFITKLDSIIDTGIAKKQWMLYGSMNYKGDTSTPYLYSKNERLGIIYNHHLSEISLSKLFEEEMHGRSARVENYLPTFLSVRGFIQRTELQDRVIEGIKAYNKRRKPHIIRTKKEEELLKDIKFIKDNDLIELISVDRANDYNEWIRVGWALFNIGQGHEEALKLWIQFSKRSDKFVDGECEDEWSRMKLRNMGMGTLLWWARNDSPDEYRKNMQYGLKKLLLACLRPKKPAEYDVAAVVCAKYRNRFKVDIIGRKDVWYEFQDHRWKEIPGEISLRLLLPEEIADEFGELLQELSMQYRSTGDEKYSVYIKRCVEIMWLLKTDAYQSKVIKQCKLKMFDGEFLKKMDEDRELVGCENGVLDLRNGIFRPGEPGDYISFSTGLYYQEYAPGGPEDKELDEYLLKTFPNINLRNYFQDFICSCLRGGNVHKRFLVKTGDGDNGKSITVKFIELVFGDYAGKFPRELLIRGRGNSSGQARPELARIRGKRIMFCQEIGNAVDELNVGVLKELTGNDSFYVRTLFEKGAEITPQFTLILQCNDPPKIPGNDRATWSRIRVLDYESNFIKPQDIDIDEDHTVPKTLEEQVKQKRFMADPCFEEKLPFLAPVLLWKLFQRYIGVYKDQGLREPKEVLASTDNYKTSNDIYQQFISEKIKKIDDKKVAKGKFIRLVAMYDEFKEWNKINYPSYRRSVVGRNEMRNKLIKRMSGIIKNEKQIYGFKDYKWWGYKIIMEDEPEGMSTKEKMMNMAGT